MTRPLGVADRVYVRSRLLTGIKHGLSTFCNILRTSLYLYLFRFADDQLADTRTILCLI